MTVDGTPAVCASLECDFAYTEPTSEVTEMTVSGSDVTIAGTGLPEGAALLSVTIAMTDCAVQTSSAIEITCILQDPWVGGDWTPEVRDVNGLAPLASGYTAHHVDIVVSSVSPDIDLNPAGGEELVIIGSGFP